MAIGVISDIHGNLSALQAVLEDLPPIDDLWCLGDIVGYGPHPNECVELLSSHRPSVVVAGNHDWAAIGRMDTASFNPEAAEAIEWTASRLTLQSRRYLEALPTLHRAGEWTIVHGSPRHHVWEYLFTCADARPSFRYFDSKYCLVGHTHVPAIFVNGIGFEDTSDCQAEPIVVGKPVKLGQTRAIINPGSVGQPRDGDPTACYVLLNVDQATVEYRRVEYDIRRTQEAMKSAGLPSRLWMRLAYGL